MNVEEIVSNKFASIMKMPPGELDLNASLRDRYNVDSVHALKLLSQVEVEFDIEIEQDEARDIKTLNDVIHLVSRKLD